MSVNIKYKSETVNSESARKIINRTYYSFDYSELESFIAENFPEGKDSEIGEIVRVRFYREGVIWYCDVQGEADFDSAGLQINYGNRREHPEPQKHTLRTVTISLPLRVLDNYRTCWDHHLWAEVPFTTDHVLLPEEIYTSFTEENSFYHNNILFVWTLSDHAPAQAASSGKRWLYVRTPVKHGIKHITYHTYQITEFGEYNTESAAAWAVQKALNEVFTKPLLGDMGVGNKGGQWKLDDAQIRNNGKKWVAECVWTYMPGKWDPDLYPPQINRIKIGY